MSVRSFLFIFVLALFMGCRGDAKFSSEELEAQQSAWANMMKGHDVVMPLRNDLYQTSKELEELAQDAMVEANDFHPRAQEAIAAIIAADDGMMEWMGHIKENPLDSVRQKQIDHAAVMAFIDKETVAIESVADAMQQSLEKGKALIMERNGQ
ncbi:MAG: hypothetical protein R2795_00335 [Saprospiraceae bacterium]